MADTRKTGLLQQDLTKFASCYFIGLNVVVRLYPFKLRWLRLKNNSGGSEEKNPTTGQLLSRQ